MGLKRRIAMLESKTKHLDYEQPKPIDKLPIQLTDKDVEGLFNGEWFFSDDADSEYKASLSMLSDEMLDRLEQYINNLEGD